MIDVEQVIRYHQTAQSLQMTPTAAGGKIYSAVSRIVMELGRFVEHIHHVFFSQLL